MNKKHLKNCAPKSMGTSKVSLFFSLEIVHDFNVSDNSIAKEYDVCRDTLRNIAKGVLPTRGQEKYFEILVNLLNDMRLKAIHNNDMEEEHRITNSLRDILLVKCGIATDAEMEEIEHRKRQENILEEIRMTTR